MPTSRLVLVLLAIFAVGLLSFRLYSYFTSTPQDGPIKVKGQVLTEPYLRLNKLNFRVDRYQIVSEYQNITFGDLVEIEGVLNDYKLEANKVELLPQSGLQAELTQLRLRINQQIIENLPSPQSQLLSGVVLGVKSNLSQEFKQNLINTGTLHVVVVSGYNIALVAGLALSLSFLIGRKPASFLALLVIIAYTLLVGGGAPSIRAAIMASLTILATLLGRQALATYLLFLTAYLLLLINPENLVDISFQLTFLATLGLVIFTKPLSNLLSKLISWVREPLSTTLAAQILVIPLIFFYFGTVSLSAPLVNVLVLWTVPISTVLGFIYVTLFQISQPLANLVGYLVLVPLTIFVEIVRFFGQFGFLFFEATAGNLMVVLGYSLIILALIVSLWRRSYAKPSKS